MKRRCVPKLEHIRKMISTTRVLTCAHNSTGPRTAYRALLTLHWRSELQRLRSTYAPTLQREKNFTTAKRWHSTPQAYRGQERLRESSTAQRFCSMYTPGAKG